MARKGAYEFNEYPEEPSAAEPGGVSQAGWREVLHPAFFWLVALAPALGPSQRLCHLSNRQPRAPILLGCIKRGVGIADHLFQIWRVVGERADRP